MKPEPLKQTREPAYPTRREMLAGAASFTILCITGCESALTEGEAEGGVASPKIPGTLPQIDGIKVAPVFEHGEGRGASGCVVVSPAVFLSEEEGMQILREELEKYGLRLGKGVSLTGVRISPRVRSHEFINKGTPDQRYEPKTLEFAERATLLALDGLDTDRNIGIEFVSRGQYLDLGGVSSGCSVQDYDFKETAEHLVRIIGEQNKTDVLVVVFYDPMAPVESRPAAVDPELEAELESSVVEGKEAASELLRERRREKWLRQTDAGRKASAVLLRQQARDFVAWLQEQDS